MGDLLKRIFGAFSGRCAGEKASQRRPFMVIGHRGSPCDEPENTISSFELAVTRDGANALELDLCMTSDGELLLWHDWNPSDAVCRIRRAGLEPGVKYSPCFPEDERPVSSWNYEEFVAGHGYRTKEEAGIISDITIPTFDQFMAWASGRDEIGTLFLDIKIPETELHLVAPMLASIEATLAGYPTGARIIFETAVPAVLREMKRYRPGANYTLDVEPPAGIVLRPGRYSGIGEALRYGNSSATLLRPHANTLAPWSTHKRTIRHAVARRNRRGTGERRGDIDIVSFTVNDADEMRCLIELGVDGIQTNYPSRLRAVAEEMGLLLERPELALHPVA